MRGDVYRLKSPRNARGQEQQGTRYAVVVQSDLLQLSTWIVAPTSTSARAASFRPEIKLGGVVARVLVEQTTAVDPERLGDFVGRLAFHELDAVDKALAVVLHLGSSSLPRQHE